MTFGFCWSPHQCSTKREKRLHYSVRLLLLLGFGIGPGLGYDEGTRVLVKVRVWGRVRVRM